MNEQELKHHLDEIAREAFPDTVHPWPTFQARLQAGTNKQSQKGFSMKTQTISTKTFHPAGRIAAIIVLALLFAGAVFLITPQGQVMAQSLLRFFTRSQSNFIPAPTEVPLVWVEQTPGVPAATPSPLPTLTGAAFSSECGDYRSPRCSVEQMRSKVKFPLKELGVLPASMVFVGATGGPDQVYISYDTQDHKEFLFLAQAPWTGSAQQKAWEIGPNAVVETVEIGSLTGEYVKGSFGYRSGESQETWNENSGIQNLRLVDQGVYIVLQLLRSDGQFDRDGMVALAKSLTTEPVSAISTPVPSLTPTLTSIPPTPEPAYQFILSIAEAGQKAGFTVRAPNRLPEKMTIAGASYDPESHFVGLNVSYNDSNIPNGAAGMVIREELAPDAAHCNLCAFKVGVSADVWTDKYASIVPKDTPVTVKIGDDTGQYVEGMWENGWIWVPDPYAKRLRWQAGSVAFEIFYMGPDGTLTKDDLVTIAESMK